MTHTLRQTHARRLHTPACLPIMWRLQHLPAPAQRTALQNMQQTRRVTPAQHGRLFAQPPQNVLTGHIHRPVPARCSASPARPTTRHHDAALLTYDCGPAVPRNGRAMTYHAPVMLVSNRMASLCVPDINRCTYRNGVNVMARLALVVNTLIHNQRTRRHWDA